MSQPEPFKDELVRAVARDTYGAGKGLIKVAIILAIGFALFVALIAYAYATGRQLWWT